MYRRFGNAKFFRCRAYGRIGLNGVFCNRKNSFFNIWSHSDTPLDFVQSMLGRLVL